MINLGAQTGGLDEMLPKAADPYDEEVEAAVGVPPSQGARSAWRARVRASRPGVRCCVPGACQVHRVAHDADTGQGYRGRLSGAWAGMVLRWGVGLYGGQSIKPGSATRIVANRQLGDMLFRS